MRIEKAVESDVFGEAEEAPVVVEVEAVPTETSEEPAIVAEAEKIVEEVAVIESAEEAPIAEAAPITEVASEAEDEPRRRGFFSRIFGRK